MRSRVPFFSLCLLALTLLFSCLIPIHADGIDVDDPDTVVLTESNFDDFIAQDLVLVEFYAPWCGHCKSLAPEYAKAATELKAHDPPVPLGKLDATTQGDIASRYQISGYPTLKLFRNGKPSEYKAPGATGRKAAGIVAYMKKQAGPAVKPLTGEDELQAFVAQDSPSRYAVVAFFGSDKQTQLQPSFAVLAGRMREDFAFGKIMDNEELMRKYVKDPEAKEAIVAFSYGEPIVYDGPAKLSNVEEFIKENSVPLVGMINDENGDLYAQRGVPIAKFVMKADKNFHSKHMKYYVNRFKKIATQFQGRLSVAVADKAANHYLVDMFNLGPQEEVSLVVEHAGKKYKYEPADDAKVGKVDVDGWARWLDEVVSGSKTVKPYVKSERPPKNNDGPVKIVTGSNFDEIVNDPTKDLLLEVYAPWCGHCKALEPKYTELGRQMQKHKDLVIAKLDATANDFDRDTFKVTGYPTIFFRPASKNGKLANPVLYQGGREVEDFVKYLKANAKTLKEKTKKKKNKKAKRAIEDDDDDHDEL